MMACEQGLAKGINHLWGIILAGGEGRRLQQFIRLRYGYDRPKQYCRIVGSRSMLRHTIERVERVIPTARLMTVVNREHLSYAREELFDRPAGRVVVQPCNRDTGAGILFPLLRVHKQDPEAVVAVFPSDHFVVDGRRFMQYVETAFSFVTQSPGLVVLLGVDPERPDAGYGWIEAGDRIERLKGADFHAVNGFWEKPSPRKAQALGLRGCLWNTMVFVGQVRALLQLYQRLAPEVFAMFECVKDFLGSPGEEEAVAQLYLRLTSVNFSRSILERGPESLAVLPVRDVYWSDWGEEERVLIDLERFQFQSPKTMDIQASLPAAIQG
jgi:mannose-1-phosphate guanylyltransferase